MELTASASNDSRAMRIANAMVLFTLPVTVMAVSPLCRE